MRRIQCLCLCAATALKPGRQYAAVRPRVRAPVAKKGKLGVPTVLRDGGRSRRTSRRRVVAEGIMLYTALNLAFEHNVVLRPDHFSRDIHRKLLQAVAQGRFPHVVGSRILGLRA